MQSQAPAASRATNAHGPPPPPLSRAALQLEALLEVAGVIAAGQFALKMLFAEDREKTFTEIR